MTEKLTKNLLVRLIKEEINKAQLEEQQMTQAEIDKEIQIAQMQIRRYKSDLRRMQKAGSTVAGGRSLSFNPENYKGLNYPYGTNNMGKATDFANKMIAKLNKRVSDLKAVPTDPGMFGRMAQAVQKQFNLAQLRAKGDIDPDTRKRIPLPKKSKARGPRFLRKYRQYIPAFETEFGGRDRDAFNRFYDAVKMPRRGRDYQFGPGHFRRFQKYVAGSTPAAPQADPGPKAVPPMVDQKDIDAIIRQAASEFADANAANDNPARGRALSSAFVRLRRLGIPMDRTTKNMYRDQIRRLARPRS